jgi:hypothetical protein
LATTLTLPERPQVDLVQRQTSDLHFGATFVTVLTFAALAIHGYHPYADDGGIYLAGVKRLLNPSLYPYWSEFVTEHLRFSLFAPLLATLVHGFRLPLMMVWLAVYAAALWLTLFAAWMLVSRSHASREARCGAVALLAVWLTIPIAGTALLLMDPYLSARSISAPFCVLAMVGALDYFKPTFQPGNGRARAVGLCCGSLIIAAAVHPLMAIYGLGCVLLLAGFFFKSTRTQVAGSAGLAALATLVAAILYKTAPHESAAYRSVALTRTYWFIAGWRWYELFGLAAPIVILTAIGLQSERSANPMSRALARSGAVAGTVAILIAVLFARTSSPAYLIARLQPLRIFQMVYILMILALGALLGDRLLRRRASRWLAAFAVLAIVMFGAERGTYPGSSHFEWPESLPHNGWERAFQWVRTNTPKDALFALDPDYISLPGEDAQTFRAIAERSALADYSKWL